MVRTAADLINTKVVQEDLHESRHKIRSLVRQDLLWETKMAENVGKCLSNILGRMLFQRNRLRIVCAQIKDGQDESVTSVLANRQRSNNIDGYLTKRFGNQGQAVLRCWWTGSTLANALANVAAAAKLLHILVDARPVKVAKKAILRPVSYTHLTLPTIYSV